MQQKFVKENGRGELVNVLTNGQQGCHENVAAFHNEVGKGIPEQGFGKASP